MKYKRNPGCGTCMWKVLAGGRSGADADPGAALMASVPPGCSDSSAVPPCPTSVTLVAVTALLCPCAPHL